jgi:Protein of unknown function (DUF1615)
MVLYSFSIDAIDLQRWDQTAEKALLAFAILRHSRVDSLALKHFLDRYRRCFAVAAAVAILVASGCATGPPPVKTPSISPSHARDMIEAALPRTVSDRAGWSTDINAALAMLEVTPTRANVCAVVAVIEQESGFRVDPVIPNLPAIARREIDDRAARAGVPPIVVRTALQLKSRTGLSFSDRIDRARTERDLSEIYEDFIGAVPMGQTLFADRDPIRTRGPMQVNVAFAERYAAAKPYPYPVKSSIADEVFTRRGSLYFGTAHLLAYPARYDSYLYRFADFNAGQYASRNAAFQSAVGRLSGIPIIPDGALLPHDGDKKEPGSTEIAIRAIRTRLNLSDSAIHEALEQGRSAEFENTALYRRVFTLVDKMEGRSAPRALVPRIQLHGPKISRSLTTDWYAHRVDQRYRRCLGPDADRK